MPQQAAWGVVGGWIYFTGKIIKEWDTAQGLQVNGRSDICQCQWHTRSQSGSIPPREPKDHGQLFVMLQYIHTTSHMPHLVFLHSVWELDVKPTHVLLCCEPVIVSVEKCKLEIHIDLYIVHILRVILTDLCVDMIGIVDWGLLCAMMGHVVIFVAPVHSTKIVIL